MVWAPLKNYMVALLLECVESYQNDARDFNGVLVRPYQILLLLWPPGRSIINPTALIVVSSCKASRLHSVLVEHFSLYLPSHYLSYMYLWNGLILFYNMYVISKMHQAVVKGHFNQHYCMHYVSYCWDLSIFVITVRQVFFFVWFMSS